MDKLKLHTPDLTMQNIEKLAALFPNCVTETADEKTGQLKRAIDFDQLRQELSDHIVDGPRERYHLDWPGKREALLAANAPIAKTLRPCREESVDFDTTKNLFIEGDNLDALKLLQETYLGKVKLIYIDPPYNSGKDFVYEDDFSISKTEFLIKSNQIDDAANRLIVNKDSNGRFHSDWLSMLYRRLVIARNLLHDDGVFVASIDEREHANLVKICDEIFGSQNFCGEIVWKNSSKNDQAYISVQHEYFLVYVKNKTINKGNWTEEKQGLEDIYEAFDEFHKEFGNDWTAIHEAALKWYAQFPESNPISASRHYNWMDTRGVYFASDISGPNFGQYVYDVSHPITNKVCKSPASGWRYPESEMIQRIKDNRVHFGNDHTTIPKNKTYLKDTEKQSLTSLRYADGRAASNRLEHLFGTRVFTNPKDEILMVDLMKALEITDEDLVLDFFGGSGTTAHAVNLLNRMQGSQCRWIVVQIDENLRETLKTATASARVTVQNAINYLQERGKKCTVAEITKERFRLMGDTLGVSGSGGFRVLKIDTSNMKDVYYAPDAVKQDQLELLTNNLKDDRSPEDLLFQVLVDWGVDLALPITRETIAQKTVFFVDGNALAACFDPDISEALIKELAQRKPLRAVFRDSSFGSDSMKINAEQIFKLLSPGTELKSI